MLDLLQKEILIISLVNKVFSNIVKENKKRIDHYQTTAANNFSINQIKLLNEENKEIENIINELNN